MDLAILIPTQISTLGHCESSHHDEIVRFHHDEISDFRFQISNRISKLVKKVVF